MSELDVTDAVDTAAPNESVVSALESAPETETTETTPELSLDDELMATYNKMNPGRDEYGRFRSSKPQVEGEQPPADTQSEGQTPEVVAVEPAKPAIDAPISWPAEMKAKWAALPPETQEYVAKRESEAHSQISRMGQQVKAFEPVSQVLEQHRDHFEKYGLTFDRGMNMLLDVSRQLDANPAAAIMRLAEQKGVDLASLYGGQSGSQPPQALLQTIAQLQQQVRDLSTKDQSREQQAAEQRKTALNATLEDFLKGKDDFDMVEADVAVLIPAIRSQNPGLSPKELLEKAYDKAIWANPEARAKRLEAERKANEAKAVEDAKKRADAAKRAGSVNVKSTQNARSASFNLDDELLAIHRRNHG